jgi:hypothetical protein
MAPLTQFAIPANQKDLTGNEQTKLEQQWSSNINRWTGTAILGDPWLSLHDKNRGYYYNPLVTNIDNNPTSAPIRWTAFPNRILTKYPNATFLDQMSYAEGVHQDGTFGPPPPISGNPYAPVGPRGWQDEYCEWIAVRDASGNVTSVDFTCENPEYWFSLWRQDPNRVLELYREIVSANVQLADLYLLDSNNVPVIDRSTGLPAYSAINKWNNQPSAGAVTGAVHLISPPNTLNAEIYLAAAATLLREQHGQPVTNPGALIQCSQYGTAGRNSDPTIGSEVNKLIAGGGLVVSLQDPVGLYLQTPDFTGYTLPSDPNLPADADVSECWQIIRGTARGPNDKIDFILHARFAIPERWTKAGVTFTVSDIQINSNPIQYGAQITETFQVALRGLALPTTLPNEPLQPCRANNPIAVAAPQQVQDLNLFDAGTTSAAVTLIEQGSSVPDIVVFAVNTNAQTRINFTGGAGITVTVTDFQNVQTPQGPAQLFTVTITAAPNAALGDRALQLTNSGGTPSPAAPGQLSIVPPGTLGVHAPHKKSAALKAAPLHGAALPVAAAAAPKAMSTPERKAAAVERMMARKHSGRSS